MDKDLLKNYFNHDIDINNIIDYQLALSQLKGIDVDKNDLRKILPTLQIMDDKIIIISDTHFGSTLDNYDYIKMVFDYANKNNISTIIHGGDFIQGTYAPRRNTNYSSLEQLYEVLNNYPYDNNIKTYLLFGNHDYLALKKSYELTFDIFKSRNDINIIGLKQAYIEWKNYLVYLNHFIPKLDLYMPRLEAIIKLYGHRHEFNYDDAINHIYLPSLSDDIKYYGDVVYPGFVVSTLNDDYIEFKIYPISNNKIYEHAPSIGKELVKYDYLRK